MIFKILIFLAVLFAIYVLFFKKKGNNDLSKKGSKDSEIMVDCKGCGVYVSSKEAIIKDGFYYCSKECAKLN